MISPRAILQACWTIQESERSCRLASAWISFSMSSGKYKDCLRLSVPGIAAPSRVGEARPLYDGRAIGSRKRFGIPEGFRDGPPRGTARRITVSDAAAPAPDARY